MSNMNQLNNSLDKIAVITGATRLQGIGAAICNALAQAGIDIFLQRGQAMIVLCLGESMIMKHFKSSSK